VLTASWVRPRARNEYAVDSRDRHVEPVAAATGRPDPDSSDAPQDHEDQDDHQHQPQAATGAVAPILVVAPSWKGSQEEEDQNNQQDHTETHGLPLYDGLRPVQAAALNASASG